MTVPIFYLIVALLICLVLAAFLYNKYQKYNELELSFFAQKFDTFKQKAKEVQTITEATNLLQQYKSVVSASFLLNNNLEKIVIKTLIDKIIATSECPKLFNIIGDVAHREDSDCDIKLWRKIKFEVLSHLESVSTLTPHNYWLKRIIGQK